MKWVTRDNVKVDRVACPWLIKKFIDPEAKFYFAPLGRVMSIAEREGAIPFDVPNAETGPQRWQVQLRSDAGEVQPGRPGPAADGQDRPRRRRAQRPLRPA